MFFDNQAIECFEAARAGANGANTFAGPVGYGRDRWEAIANSGEEFGPEEENFRMVLVQNHPPAYDSLIGC